MPGRRHSGIAGRGVPLRPNGREYLDCPPAATVWFVLNDDREMSQSGETQISAGGVASPAVADASRLLGPGDFTLLVVGSIVGDGVCIVSGLAAKELGREQLLAWAFAGILAALIGLAFIQCASICPLVGARSRTPPRPSGGTQGFWPAGRSTWAKSWCFRCSRWRSNATSTTSFRWATGCAATSPALSSWRSA